MREIIGHLMDTILKPLLGWLPIHMIIFALAAFTGLYASLIQKYTMDWGLMKRVQEKSKIIQKEMREAQLSNNTQKIKKLEG
ncbi:MAG: EMC3/TMCO1 family protein, partial [Candidatus Methanoperedens sp.]|nr:EMC3/TMCO1 family protein [Candidatus Methanoperedens sp.]